MFLAALQRPKSLRDYHAIHHNFTTKTPHETITFSETPVKNAHKTTKIYVSARQEKILKKQV